jgi:hypothetical protein
MMCMEHHQTLSSERYHIGFLLVESRGRRPAVDRGSRHVPRLSSSDCGPTSCWAHGGSDYSVVVWLWTTHVTCLFLVCLLPLHKKILNRAIDGGDRSAFRLDCCSYSIRISDGHWSPPTRVERSHSLHWMSCATWFVSPTCSYYEYF